MSCAVGIVQSAYLPWKGYFDIIRKCDKFVFFDTVQFSKRSWVSRNRIKSPLGSRWISVPVSGSTSQSIREVTISKEGWVDSHLASIRQSYSTTPHHYSVEEMILSSEEKCNGLISNFNISFISMVCDYLNIPTELINASEIPQSGVRSDLLISICRHLGATKYVSGPAAKSYIGDEFDIAGIELEWMDYSNYPEYEQLHGDFEHQVSIVDLISMEGKGSSKFF